QHLVHLVAILVRGQAQRRHAQLEQGREVVLGAGEGPELAAERLDALPQLAQLGDLVVFPLFDEQDLLEAPLEGQARDEERRELEAGLRLALEVDPRHDALGAEIDLEGGVGGPPLLAQTAPDALVASRGAALAEVREAQARQIRQEHHVGGDHHRGLARPVGPLEGSDVPIEQVSLVEDALPVDEGERGCPRAPHRPLPGSSLSDTSSSSGTGKSSAFSASSSGASSSMSSMSSLRSATAW